MRFKVVGVRSSLAFAADTAQLAELGAFLRDACAEHPRRILIELAITEVVVNAIKHGAASNIRVSVTQLDGEFKLSVADDGDYFDTSKAVSKPVGDLRTSDLRTGGYGVGIIQNASSQLTYTHQGGWGTLILSFPY